jgi:crotonobetainyl-CoA:carnitine CoA-transferase CaiB-like acyl-CoA transferase
MTTPLAGIKVLDLTRYQSGPACTVQLADLGADIIKVEARGRGDEGRGVFPIPGEEVNPYFIAMNHGKRGITVDYRKPEGLELLYRLGAGCDVVVENFRPGAADGLGLGYEVFKRHNPKVVYASISAFGERGPLREMAGFDIHGQAMGGLVSTTGGEDDAYPVGAAIGDQMAGLTLSTAILAALLSRERTGVGQKVAVSLYGCQVALQAWEISYYAMTRKPPGKALHSHPIIRAGGAVWGMYPTRNGHIALGVLGPEQWERFFEQIGLDDGGGESDQFFRDASERQEEIREKLRERTTEEWLQALRAADIHVGKVNTYEDIVNDPQARENGYIVTLEAPDGRKYDLVGSAIQFSETPVEIRDMPPELGEHTEQVLGEFGLRPEEIARLREAEVV